MHTSQRNAVTTQRTAIKVIDMTLRTTTIRAYGSHGGSGRRAVVVVAVVAVAVEMCH